MKGAELSDSRRKQEVKTGEEITSREESFWSTGGRYRGEPRDSRPNSVAPQNTQHQQPWRDHISCLLIEIPRPDRRPIDTGILPRTKDVGFADRHILDATNVT